MLGPSFQPVYGSLRTKHRQDDLNFEQVGFMLMKFRLFVS